jgi:CBS domain-containing protein
MKVKQAMHPGASWIAPGASLPEIAERMRNDDVGALPVEENDRLIGIVTDRDIVMRGLSRKSDPLQLTARDVMSKPSFYCNANEDLEDAVTIMKSKGIRRLPVVDDKRQVVGMLSLGDVAAKVSASLSAETLRAVSAHHS